MSDQIVVWIGRLGTTLTGASRKRSELDRPTPRKIAAARVRTGSILVLASIWSCLSAGTAGADGTRTDVLAAQTSERTTIDLAGEDWSIGSYLSREPFAGHFVQVGPDTLFTWNGFVRGAASRSYEEQQPQLLFSLGPASLVTLTDRNRRFVERERPASSGNRSNGKSFGLNRLGLGLSQQVVGAQLSLAADYGEAKLPVHPDFELVDSDDLLRLGTELAIGGFRLTGSVGYEVKPFKIGDTLSWDLAAIFGEGPWTVGLTFAETTFTESPIDVEAEVLNTFQAGIRYNFAPRMSGSVSAIYWGFSDDQDRGYSDLAGVVGLSWKF